MSKRVDALLGSVCEPDSALAPVLRHWCLASRPFLAFAEAHASKIRRKVRLAQTPDVQHDLLAELALAAFWLQDRRFAVQYEAQKAGGGRSADLRVIFKTHTALEVEVTRLRLAPPVELEAAALRLARVLCDKITQFAGGSINLLVVVVPPEIVQTALISSALRLLDRAVSGETGPLLHADVQAFQRGRLRLSGVALCAFKPDGQPQTAQLWPNAQARHPLPPEVVRYLGQFGSGGVGLR